MGQFTDSIPKLDRLVQIKVQLICDKERYASLRPRWASSWTDPLSPNPLVGLSCWWGHTRWVLLNSVDADTERKLRKLYTQKYNISEMQCIAVVNKKIVHCNNDSMWRTIGRSWNLILRRRWVTVKAIQRLSSTIARVWQAFDSVYTQERLK